MIFIYLNEKNLKIPPLKQYIYFAMHIKVCTWKIKGLWRFFIASEMKDPRWWVRCSEWVHHGKGCQIFSLQIYVRNLFSISLYKQRWLVSEEIFFFFLPLIDLFISLNFSKSIKNSNLRQTNINLGSCKCSPGHMPCDHPVYFFHH